MRDGTAYFAEDPNFQVLLVDSPTAPTLGDLQRLRKARQGQKALSIVVAAVHGDDVSILAPHSDEVAVVSEAQAQTALQEALNESDELLARDRLHSLLSSHISSEAGDDPLFGVNNRGLFARHYLQVRVPERRDWQEAKERGQAARSLRGLELIDGLGFTRSEGPNGTQLLSGKSAATRAVAVLLSKKESWDAPSPRFELSPVAFGLREAAFREAPWVIAVQGSRLRLYSGKPGIGVGQQGQADTFFEVDLAAVDDEQVGLVPLVFSPEALSPGGSVEEILQGSARYATGLGDRLRERIYADVVPALAVNIAEQLPALGTELDEDGLQRAYSAALHVLFRLLFQAYAEDRGLLPAGRNEHYDERSLVRFMTQEQSTPPGEYGESSSIWHRMLQVWDVIEHGDAQWQVPPYSGGLFSEDANVNPTGALLRDLRVPNSVLGPALQALLLDTGEDGTFGPVDFRALSVRQFGTIYEGLLESSLSLAPEDLSIDNKGQWVPTAQGKTPDVRGGEPYFHTASGERKATGSYFTPELVVDHLVERSVRPGIEKHLQRIITLMESGKQNQAAKVFFDFRVADLAMGSGHFLTAAVDEIESRMRDFLTEHPIPGVQNELLRLAKVASDALGEDTVAKGEVEEVALLRRQIARRCVYGVDINPLSTELARLALWIHTFVPGLPLSNLDHNLVCANSLTGIGSASEALDALVPDRDPNIPTFVSDLIEEPLIEGEELLRRAAAIGEANRAEQAQAAALLNQAAAAVKPVEGLFDAAVAVRTGDLKAPKMLLAPEQVDILTQKAEVRDVAERLKPAHMPVLFPEVFLRDNPGFDVVIGNPPWEKVKVEIQRWWGFQLPGIRSFPQDDRNRIIEDLRRQRPDLEAQYQDELKRSAAYRSAILAGPFQGLGHGDLDLYQAFAWRNWTSLRQGGRMALVLPRDGLSGAALGPWRSQVLDSGGFPDVVFVNNSGKWLFEEVDGRYTVALVTAEKGGEQVVRFVGPVFNEEEMLSTRTSLATVPAEEFQSMSRSGMFPALLSENDGKALRVFLRHPRVSEETLHAKFRPYRELDTSNDKDLMEFDLEEPKGRIPVAAGASFIHWNPDHSVPYGYGQKSVLRPVLESRFLKGTGSPRSPYSGMSKHEGKLPMDSARIAFRKVTNRTNQRTMVVSLLPPGTAAADSAQVLVRQKGDAKAEAYLLGVLSSIPFDWQARRWVEMNMTFRVLNENTVPEYLPGDPLVERIVEIAGRLAAVDDRYSEWAAEVGVPTGSVRTPEEKEDLIAELDALVALRYGLSRDQVEHIFKTFHRGWDPTERLNQVLRHYDDWENSK